MCGLTCVLFLLSFMCTCSSFFDSKGESAVTRFTAATLIPGGAKVPKEEAEDCSDSAVSDSVDWDETEPGVSTLGCCDVVLKLITGILRKPQQQW